MIYSMPLRPPVKVKQLDNIWTSVIAAFRQQTLIPPMNDTILKEKESITSKSMMKVRCKVCQRKLKHTFQRCNRKDCPLIEQTSNQILTFKDWKDTPFDVIEDLQCKTKTYDNWSQPTNRVWNTLTNQWEDQPINYNDY